MKKNRKKSPSDLSPRKAMLLKRYYRFIKTYIFFSNNIGSQIYCLLLTLCFKKYVHKFSLYQIIFFNIYSMKPVNYIIINKILFFSQTLLYN